jgi:archaemetzincin
MRTLALCLSLLALSAGAGEERIVRLVPLGDVEPELLEAVSAAISARVNAKVEIAAKEELPADAFYKPRKRWRADTLLTFLDSKSAGAWRVVGVTNAEISTTKGSIIDWGIAGLGSIGGPSCVVTAYLYKKYSRGKERMIHRFADCAVHELGHTLGMPHCETPGCVMADAKGNAIKSADESSGDYCEPCRKLAPEGSLKPPVK